MATRASESISCLAPAMPVRKALLPSTPNNVPVIHAAPVCGYSWNINGYMYKLTQREPNGRPFSGHPP